MSKHKTIKDFIYRYNQYHNTNDGHKISYNDVGIYLDFMVSYIMAGGKLKTTNSFSHIIDNLFIIRSPDDISKFMPHPRYGAKIVLADVTPEIRHAFKTAQRRGTHDDTLYDIGNPLDGEAPQTHSLLLKALCDQGLDKPIYEYFDYTCLHEISYINTRLMDHHYKHDEIVKYLTKNKTIATLQKLHKNDYWCRYRHYDFTVDLRDDIGERLNAIALKKRQIDGWRPVTI